MLEYNSFTQCQHPVDFVWPNTVDQTVYNRGQRSAWKPSRNDMSTMPAKGNSGELFRNMRKAGINEICSHLVQVFPLRSLIYGAVVTCRLRATDPQDPDRPAVSSPGQNSPWSLDVGKKIHFTALPHATPAAIETSHVLSEWTAAGLRVNPDLKRYASENAPRIKPLGKRNATAPAAGGNLGGFCVSNHALVFVRLAHDRRFVGAVLLLFVLFALVFIRMISGRHRVARDHEWTPVDQPSGKFLGDAWGHVVAPPKQASPKQSRRVSGGLGQHCIQL
jgi:hypothetical protein